MLVANIYSAALTASFLIRNGTYLQVQNAPLHGELCQTLGRTFRYWTSIDNARTHSVKSNHMLRGFGLDYGGLVIHRQDRDGSIEVCS